MTRILITNMVVLNGGDAAILFGMLKSLRRAFGADSAIHVYASQPAVANRLFPEIDFRETLGLAATRAPFASVRYLGRICRTLQQVRYAAAAWCWARGLRFAARCLPASQRRYLQEYAQADFVASGGGTYLKEEYGVLSQACDYRLTLLLGRPLVFFTQSLGPFKRADTRKIMKAVFSRASCILLRDERSRQQIRDLGVTNVSVHLAADAAFALADPAVLERAKHPRPACSPGPRVAISVRHWAHFATCSADDGMNRYRYAIAQTVRSLAARGAWITFVSTCQGVPEYDDDASEAERIVALLDAETASQVVIVREFIRFEGLVECLKEFDFCIATRMHMCILSLISGTPVLPIAYEFKTRELFVGLGLGSWVTDIESVSPCELADRALAFEQSIPSLRSRLFERVLDLHRDALHAADRVRDALETVA